MSFYGSGVEFGIEKPYDEMGGSMPADLKITTELLYKSALVFALLDAIYIPLLMWRVSDEAFRRLRWTLVIVAALVWYGIWNWALSNFWDTVYVYVFPAWAQIWIPWIAFVAAGVIAYLLWILTLRLKRNLVPAFCLMGGVIGSLTHIWAVYRGIVTKPPMLQGASPLAAILIAFFEYVFYWCTILVFAKIMNWIWIKVKQMNLPKNKSREN
jgi:hypothetical protein